jgi:5-methylcytosine-specific restriction endonuclease McrA
MTRLTKRRQWRLPHEPERDVYGRRIRLRHPPELKERLAAQQHNACAHCGLPMGLVPDDATDRRVSAWLATLEHVVPFSKGGADDETNLVAVHSRCNR